MNITFLIGNGFDIDKGIQSSYAKFYEWYCNQSSCKRHIGEFRKNIKDDIIRDVPDDEKTWADFEMGLGRYTTKFTKDTVEDFLDCLEDGQESVRKYLLEQEAKFNPDAYTDISYKSFYHSIRDFYTEVSDLERPAIQTVFNSRGQESKEIKFISFNYTHTLERIIKKLPTAHFATWQSGGVTFSYRINREVLHVHGTTKEFPVLGVNDESQIVNKELLETPQFREMMCKADSVRAIGKRWHEEAERQMVSSRFVCILGMSLGDSDAKWWRLLNQWLKTDSNRHLLIYWFEKEPPNGISIRRELQYKEKVKNRLLSFSDFSPDVIKNLKNRIYVIINTPRFLKLKEPEKSLENESDVEATLATV